MKPNKFTAVAAPAGLKKDHPIPNPADTTSDASTELDSWLDSYEVMKRLHISKRTLFRWRKKGIVPYTRMGGKYFYREKDVQRVMMKNYKKV
jgi:hypothetical protein